MMPIKQVLIVEHLEIKKPRDNQASLHPGMAPEDAAADPFVAALEELVGSQGRVLHGPRKSTPAGLLSEYLLVLVRPAQLDELAGEYVRLRQGDGEIFSSNDGLYHVDGNDLLSLEGEVLLDVYSRLHGAPLPDLVQDFDTRLLAWATGQIADDPPHLHDQLLQGFRELAHETRASAMTWKLLGQMLAFTRLELQGALP